MISNGQLISGLSDSEIIDLYYDWKIWARPEQLPPAGDWNTWLLIGGRGSGKTRAGAEWVRDLATTASEGIPVSPIALVGETISQARAIMVEGESGILNVGAPEHRPQFDQTRNMLKWSNGVEAHLMSGSDPERFRGPQFAAAWCDELAKWPNSEAAWDMLQFGLRLGTAPRQLVTTTPRPTRLLKRLLSDPNTAVTRMKTDDNSANLAAPFLRTIVERYRGTNLGRQELDGQLLEEREDGLWSLKALQNSRQMAKFEPDRVVVAVDPAVSSHARSDACGIIVAGRKDDKAIIMADRTLKPAPPLKWAARVVRAYHEFGADAVVAEVNQGGDLVANLIAQIDPLVPVISVHATRGKWVRAEPVAALYEKNLIAHQPGLEALEDEMCAFGPDGKADGHSPDRVDALVWALTELMMMSLSPRVRGL